MSAVDNRWELTILDADPLVPLRNMHSQVAGDVDHDGNVELIVGGHGGLLWYRPATFERGVISSGDDFTVGLALHDIDGDGFLEVITAEGKYEHSDWWITWYKPGKDLNAPWQRFVIDPNCTGLAHDIVFSDIDGDGQSEMVANAVFSPMNGVFLYKPGEDIKQPWKRHTVVRDIHAEGLAAADLDGDGKVEIINGPDWFKAPQSGPYSGVWKRTTYAPDMREMCRVLLTDITGNGLPDILLLESEYRDGKLAWYENQSTLGSDLYFKEHRIENGFVFAHSFDLWNSQPANSTGFLLAEMAQGGWNQPYNYTAKLLRFLSHDRGLTWESELIYTGAGTHQAHMADIDGDGELEVVGHECSHPRVQIWDQKKNDALPIHYQHKFIDRDKPYTSTDLLIADVDGDGVPDVVSGAWWYHNPTWDRYAIPGAYQVITNYDLDGDGKQEFIATQRAATTSSNWYDGLSSQLVWLKPIDAIAGSWELHPIGIGKGDWPHGSLIAPLLPGNKLALFAAYHSCWNNPSDYPEIFEIPDDPRQHPWPVHTLAKIQYSENFIPVDIDRDGKVDIVAGIHWLENDGSGAFLPHRITDEEIDVAQCAVADINGNGWPDVLVSDATAEVKQNLPMPRLMWFENPGVDSKGLWKKHVIDLVRWGHSLAVADIDGDGELEVICGEHDPNQPYRNHCRLFLYKRFNPQSTAWKRFTLNDQYEHHCGAKLMDTNHGLAILSHGWGESRYLHIWEPPK